MLNTLGYRKLTHRHTLLRSDGSEKKAPSIQTNGESYSGSKAVVPNWAKKLGSVAKESGRKAGFVATTATVAGVGAAMGCLPLVGFFSNLALGEIAMGKLFPESTGASELGGIVGVASNLGGTYAWGAMEATMPLAIGGIVGGISGGIVGTKIAEQVFGKWNRAPGS